MLICMINGGMYDNVTAISIREIDLNDRNKYRRLVLPLGIGDAEDLLSQNTIIHIVYDGSKSAFVRTKYISSINL